jgi:hypothetical protein
MQGTQVLLKSIFWCKVTAHHAQSPASKLATTKDSSNTRVAACQLLAIEKVFLTVRQEILLCWLIFTGISHPPTKNLKHKLLSRHCTISRPDCKTLIAILLNFNIKSNNLISFYLLPASPTDLKTYLYAMNHCYSIESLTLLNSYPKMAIFDSLRWSLPICHISSHPLLHL